MGTWEISEGGLGMRNKLLAAALGIGFAAAVVPQQANAAPSVTHCSTGSLVVCAGFDSYYSGGNLFLEVWNLYDGTAANGVQHAITFAGIGNNWSGTASLVSATLNGSGGAGWVLKDPINNNPVGDDMNVAGVTANGINDAVWGGGHLVLEFSLSGTLPLTDAVYGWHSQAVDGTTCSIWVATNGDQAGPSSSDECYNNVVPEPITMVLVGSGLLGIGGAGLKRRRKGLDVTNA